MLNIIITILLSTVKFGMTFPLAIMEFKFSWLETILWINLGGILGIYFFAYLSEWVNRWLNKLTDKILLKRKKVRKKKKVFTKKNRRIVKIKQRYGLVGIAVSTPILLSIPIGVFLLVRYFPRVRSRYFTLIGTNFVWSLFYTWFYMFWNDVLFN